MANVKTISSALKLIDTKKENLRKAFKDLQLLSSSLSSFSLTWPDLDYYFTSLQSSLEHKFTLLQSQELQSQSPPEQPSSPIRIQNPAKSAAVPARPELKSLCEKMNGLGLRRYIVDRSKDRAAIRNELPDALRCSPNAPAMVLDAMEGFYKPNSRGDRDKALCAIRSGCLILLEELLDVKPEIKPEVRERAMKLAVEWKGKASLDWDNSMDSLGFLHLLATYGLVDGFDMDEVVDFAVVAATARHRQAIKLCRMLGFGDRISDVIKKLISKGKRLPAVKLIFEFGLAAKFPPVPFLKEFLKESKKFAQDVRNDQKSTLQSLNEAKMKEVSALQQVIKCIEDHKLESEYPKENLVKRLAKLKKETASKRKAQPLTTNVAQQQFKRREHSVSKRPRTIASASPAAIRNGIAAPGTNVPPLQEHPALYLSSSAGPYGFAASTHATDPYGSTHAIPAYGPTPPTGPPHSVTAYGPIPGTDPYGPTHAYGPTSSTGPSPAGPSYGPTPADPYGPTPATGPSHAVHPYGPTAAVGPSPVVTPYGSGHPSSYQASYAGLYSSAEMPLSLSVNPTHNLSQQYSSETHVTSAYTETPVAHVEYGLPQQYHPSYYQQ